ncbi:MAG: tetratricopeptide repeat protein [Muribaculaceae bacterium]|nr:tetratricopeptide repeat protein [Muribaculaceae bacterium]
MKTRRLILSALCCLSLYAGAREINPLTQAMLDGYETLLQQNPNDYLTLYERSSQYYRLDDYDKALSDIKRAIGCTPAKETSQLASEYALLADIYTQTEEYPEALMAIDQALGYDANSYRLLYMKGNICLHLDRLSDARSAFTAMMRVNSRSTEAIFGLARVAALEGKNDEATKLLKDAEKMDPTNYLTYCRMGDIHQQMNMPQDAAADYLSAFSLASNSDRPMSSIIALAKENYPAVEQAIDYSLQKTQNVIPLHFIQANAALAADEYDDAYSAYQELLANIPEADAVAFYPDLAEINLHRGDLNDADNYASKAMMHKPDIRTNILKAKIEQVRGNYPSAQMYAKSALALDADNHDALMTAAEIANDMEDYSAAVAYLNNAIMNDAGAVDALIFRGYLNANRLNNAASAMGDFARAASLPATTAEQLTYKAIAQIKGGQALDASSTIAPIYASSENNGEAAYLYALYCLACDKNADAQSSLDKAQSLGFDDNFLLKYYSVPLLSVKALRK